jgi:hypothetical protein
VNTWEGNVGGNAAVIDHITDMRLP